MNLNKIFNISVSSKLKISFFVVTSLSVLLGLFSFLYISQLSSLTQKMYKHPFTVSNTVRDVNSKIIAMHRSMKDVALSNNTLELNEAIKKVDNLEESVIKDYELIFERFLGDETSVRKKYDSFLQWKEIRDEVIELVKAGDKASAAAITKEKGARYVEKLNNEMIDLILFANNKAKHFLDNAKKEKDKALLLLVGLIVIIFILGLYISRKITQSIVYPIETLSKGLNGFFLLLQGKTKTYEPISYHFNDEFTNMISSVNENIQITKKLHDDIAQQQQEQEKLLKLLDKHIIFSKTDTKGTVTHVSEAFCRVSGYSSEELLGQPHSIIRHEDTPKEVFETIWNSLKEEVSISAELKNRKKNGDYYWVDSMFEPDYNDGKLVGYTALRVDITDKKEVQELSKNLEIKVEQRTKEIQAIHKHTRESIEYASLIQGALVPEDNILDRFFKDNFVHWEPKDIVGGDIWLFSELRHEDECLLLFIDCTGHGVPGAFVTMIVKAIEREVVAKIKADKDNNIDVSPAWIMAYFNKTTKLLLKQMNKDSKSNAGWDGGVVYYNKRTQILKFAGAETPLFYTDTDGVFNTVKGNRYSVGYKKCAMDYEYKESIIEVQEGMKFYCTTDGYLDQNGGEKGFPFGKKKFGNIVKEQHILPMQEQKAIFLDEMQKYEIVIPDNDRNDDMTVIAFEIGEKSDFIEVEIEEIVKYEGVMTQNVIATCADNVEAKISNIGVMGKVSALIVEYCQNMINYSKDEEIGSRQIVAAGEIEVQYINNEYYNISALSIVSIEDKEIIEPILIEIQGLDKESLKIRYRELRKVVDASEEVGGMNLYKIAKESDSIEYSFTPINEDKYYLRMKSIAKVISIEKEI